MRVPKSGETFAEIAVREVIIVKVISVDQLRNTAIVEDSEARKIIIRARKIAGSLYEAVAEAQP